MSTKRLIDIVTIPKSLDEFVAKEGLWAAGQETGISKHNCSRLLGELLFPIMFPRPDAYPDAASIARTRVLSREDIGIVAMTRTDALIGESPVKLVDIPPSKSEVYYKIRFPDDTISLNEAAIQLRGLLDLPKRPDLAADICTPKALDALQTTAEYFAELISQ